MVRRWHPWQSSADLSLFARIVSCTALPQKGGRDNPGEQPMNAVHVARLVLSLRLSLYAMAAYAQSAPATQKLYEPSVGQEGKDVVWVPTPQALVDKMLDMAKFTPQDYVIDLGSGDGRT